MKEEKSFAFFSSLCFNHGLFISVLTAVSLFPNNAVILLPNRVDIESIYPLLWTVDQAEVRIIFVRLVCIVYQFNIRRHPMTTRLERLQSCVSAIVRVMHARTHDSSCIVLCTHTSACVRFLLYWLPW